MTDMPNELWIDTLACEGCPQVFTADCGKGFVKYTRSDKSDHLRKALEGAVEALTRADKFFFNSTVCGNDLSDLADEMQKAIRAAKEALK